MRSWILILLTFLPFLAAIIAYMLGRRDERMMNGFVSITGIVIFALSAALLFLPEGEVAVPGFCGLGLYLRADGFRGLYSCVAAFMWMMTGLFAPEYFQHHGNSAVQLLHQLMTLGATLGVFLWTTSARRSCSLKSCRLPAMRGSRRGTRGARSGRRRRTLRWRSSAV
ncbi:MAG: hypothetical protein ACLT1X_06155 [Christensenellales bacterium]